MRLGGAVVERGDQPFQLAQPAELHDIAADTTVARARGHLAPGGGAMAGDERERFLGERAVGDIGGRIARLMKHLHHARR